MASLAQSYYVWLYSLLVPYSSTVYAWCIDRWNAQTVKEITFLSHSSHKTVLHQGSLFTILRPAKSCKEMEKKREKSCCSGCQRGALWTVHLRAYALCAMEQEKTVMADKEGHFICGSSFIPMKSSHLWGHADILQTALALDCAQQKSQMQSLSSLPRFILLLLLMTVNDPRRAAWYAHLHQCAICIF